MGTRGGRASWGFAIPVFLLGLWTVAVSVVVWRGLGPHGSRFVNHVIRMIGGAMPGADTDGLPAGPTRLDDPRLATLRNAAESWRRKTGPKRQVIDQVCLVPNEVAFLEAIAAWDERFFFPILIDEPAWTLPFLRVFRPAKVVRYAGRGQTATARSDGGSLNAPPDLDRRWAGALDAVSHAWSGPSDSQRVLPASDLPPRHVGAIAPGVVLAESNASMLAGAIALAAGRFQPLVRFQVSDAGLRRAGQPRAYMAIWRRHESRAGVGAVRAGSRYGSRQFSNTMIGWATTAISLHSPAIGPTYTRSMLRWGCSEGVMRSTI